MASNYQCKNVAERGHATGTSSKMCLLNWVSTLLDTKIETFDVLRSGAAYCQIWDMLFPGSIPLKNVNFAAKQTHEFQLNFQMLEKGFHAVGCLKEIPMDRLVTGRFKDHFEFLQWLKYFYEVNSASSDRYIGLQTTSKGRKCRSVLTLKPEKEDEMESPEDIPPEGLPPAMPAAEPQ